MDFLSALPEDVFNEVAVYFSSKDVLKASLVCKGWYQIFGQSKECMKKVTVRYNNINAKNNVSPLMKSNRKYQNLIIGFDHVRMKESGVELNIKAILKKFSKSLVTLETSHDFQRICCEFPKLKEMLFKNHSFSWNRRFANYFCTNGLLSKSINLKKLDIQCGELDNKSGRLLVQCIKDMNKLKSLSVNQLEILEQLQTTTDYQFRLDEIDISGYHRAFWNKIDIIYDFLRTHRLTLRVVRVDKVRMKDIAFFFSEFPKMHTFHIRNIGPYPKNLDINLTANTSIKKLIIATTVQSSEVRQKLSEILVYCQNLKELKVHLLHVRFLNAFPACPSLTKVEYCFLSKFTPPNYYAYIKNNNRIEFRSNPYSCN